MQLQINKQTPIFIIHNDAGQRQAMIATLRNFSLSQTPAEFSTISEFMLSAPRQVGWILTSTMLEENKTVLDLLNFLANHSEFHKMRASVFVSLDHQSIIPQIFELGALSWHPLDFAAKALQEALAAVLTQLRQHHNDDVRVSANFLRQYLRANKYTKSQIALEERLIEQFPGDASLLINLARANFDAGQIQASDAFLKQAKFLDSRLTEEAMQLQVLLDTAQTQIPLPVEGAFGIETCLIVDSDTAAALAAENLIVRFNIKNIHRFTDPETAFAWILKNGEPDLIVQEWRFPKLTGAAFIQRLRNSGFHWVNIVVLSAQVQKSDAGLLQEMNVANVINKPVQPAEFQLAMRWNLLQNQLPTEQRALERKIYQFLHQGKMADARKLKAAYFANPKISMGRKALIDAHFNFYSGRYMEAKDRIIESIRLSDTEPLMAINLLGKALVKLGDQKSALQCFEKAKSLSPDNIKRLCDIAEIQLDEGRIDDAIDTIKQVNAIDKENPAVVLSSLKVIVTANNLAHAQALMEHAGTQIDFVSFMNNRAIAKTRAGEAQQAVALYLQAIELLPKADQHLGAILYYNLGLAYARTDQLNQCIDALNLALRNDGANLVKEKAESLRERALLAMRTGEKLVLQLPNETGENEVIDDNQGVEFESFLQRKKNGKNDTKSDEALVAGPKRGDFCLRRIFHFLEATDVIDEVAGLRIKTPKAS